MSIYTDLLSPATLTGYARASLEDRESQGTLESVLPNRLVPDISVRFIAGSNGLVEAASYRAYDAEVDVIGGRAGERKTLELPPLGIKTRVSEYDQLRLRNAPESSIQSEVLRVTDQVVASVSDRVEALRGQVLDTGTAAIDENGFIATADYGRDPEFDVTAGTLWNDSDADPFEDLLAWAETYTNENGEAPGRLIVSQRVQASLMRSPVLINLLYGSDNARSIATVADVTTAFQQFSLPAPQLYNRRVRRFVQGQGVVTQRVLPDHKAYLLPSSGGSLGATFWGQTLESDEPEYALQEQPGLVAGLWKTKDPIGLWVHSAAIALPVLANANLSMAATVLPEA